jgi:hypothetical protein
MKDQAQTHKRAINDSRELPAKQDPTYFPRLPFWFGYNNVAAMPR